VPDAVIFNLSQIYMCSGCITTGVECMPNRPPPLRLLVTFLGAPRGLEPTSTKAYQTQGARYFRATAAVAVAFSM
jgi:hypothetical protein